MKVKTYSWDDVHKAATQIAMQMYKDNWRPDYIVGLTRGGLPLSVILSNLTGIPMHTLGISFRDTDIGPESNLWMAEDAFGYVYEPDRDDLFGTAKADPEVCKKILIVDDINDTGATFEWIVDDWQSGCLPHHERWGKVWGDNVRFAVMTENLSSNFSHVTYYYDEVNKAEQDVWLKYPWE